MPKLRTITRFALRREVLIVFGFALGILFGFLASRGIEWAKLREEFGRVSITAALAAFALAQASAFLRTVRWRLTWVTHRVSTLRLFVVENASLGLNSISPVRLLDEPAIVAMLTLNDGYPAPVVVASVVMTRVQDLAFTLSFIAVAVAITPELSQHAWPVVFSSVLFAVLLVALLNLGRLTERFAILRRIPGVASFETAVHAMWRRKRRLAMTFSLTAVYWLVLGPAAWVLAQAMGIDVTPYQATIVVLGAVFFATSTPGLPGAIGTFELAVVEMLSLWDVPRPAGLSFGIVLHLVLFAPPVLIAVVALPREGIGFALTGLRKPPNSASSDHGGPE